MNIVTIGAYGFQEETFFRALQAANVTLFCDIRQRRGVRGAEYAFVNSQRLQKRLAELNIAYEHRPELAPTPAIRTQQKAADKAAKIAKRKRSDLSPQFIATFQQDVLTHFNPQAWLAEIGPQTSVVALFCVEREPAACHRSLVAQKLQADLGLSVRHLLPE